jgi:predicted TIM-barrel fold metal-dependent hydrolase
MIIDSHTHVQRTSGFWDSPPERIISLMDDAGISMSVIMTYSDSASLVDYIHQSVQKYPDRLIAYARLDPSGGEESCRVLKHAITNLGFKGLKLHPVGNLVHPSADSSLELIRTAAGLNVPTLFHCGDEELTLPLQIASAAEKCPEAEIILGHMGGYFHVEDAILAAEKFSNIYLETSAMPYPERIAEAVKRIGADRVLFASDGPGCPPDLELKKVKLAVLSPSDEEKVLGGNIMRILGM